MSEKLNQLRDQALASCIAEFDEKIAKSVETFTEADVTDEDIQCVKDKYRNAYKNFFTTAFDIAFQKELLAKLKENQKEEKNNSVEIIEDEDLNLSVTDEDLQKLDNANTLVTIYRKVKPPKCTLLLEKSLKLQIGEYMYTFLDQYDSTVCKKNIYDMMTLKNVYIYFIVQIR